MPRSPERRRSSSFVSKVPTRVVHSVNYLVDRQTVTLFPDCMSQVVGVVWLLEMAFSLTAKLHVG